MEINHYKYIKNMKKKNKFLFFNLFLLFEYTYSRKPRIWKERSDPILLLNRFIYDWTRVCQKLIYALGLAAAPFFLGLFLDFSILALIY